MHANTMQTPSMIPKDAMTTSLSATGARYHQSLSEPNMYILSRVVFDKKASKHLGCQDDLHRKTGLIFSCFNTTTPE